MWDEPYDPPRLSPIDTADLVTAAVQAAKPFSLVRLGDGECAMLGIDAESPPTDTQRSLTIWFGPAHPPLPALRRFAEELRGAVRNADLVGIPRASRQRKGPHVSYLRPLFENHRLHSAHTVYTDSGSHNFFQFLRALDPWLRGRAFLGLVTCRDLSARIAQTFQVKDIVWHRIPADFLTSQQVAVPPHFPDVYEALRGALRPPLEGALYLVGAGVFGKVYCDWIKRRGGIAIDIGSVFDGWAGVQVRERLQQAGELYSLERYRIPLERAARIADFRTAIRHLWLAPHVTPEEIDFLLSEGRRSADL